MAASLTMPPLEFSHITDTGFRFDLSPGASGRGQAPRCNCLFDCETAAWRAAFLRRCRCCVLVFAAMAVIHVIQGCTAAQIKGGSANRLGAEIRSLVNRLAKSPCSLKEVESILSATIASQQPGRYAIIKSPQHSTIAAITDEHGESVVTELVIYPQSETDLQFKDLQGMIADCKIVADRKSSAVAFQRVGADRKIIVDVYVTLLFPPTAPKSRVVSILIKVNSKETPEG